MSRQGSEYKNATTSGVLLLLGLSMLFFTALGSFHLFDWDEINFAEAAREMIVTGDYLSVQIDYQPFWEKPPLFFWLQAVSMQIFGVGEFAARFPNAVFGVIYLLTFFYVGRRWHGHRFGLIWALLYYGSLLPHVYFRTGIIDPVFNYFILMSVYFTGLVANGTSSKNGKYALLAGIFSGLSVITKGPVGFLILALTAGLIFAWQRFRNLPHIKHFLFFLLGMIMPVSIWLGAEYITHGTEVLARFINYQVELFNQPVAGHGQPFYYHFVVVFLGCFPASVFVLPRLFNSGEATTQSWLSSWMRSLFWVVMVLFSLSTTKIVHYSSLAWVPLTYLAARELTERRRSGLQVLYLGLSLLWTAVFVLVPYLLSHKEWVLAYVKDSMTRDIISTSSGWNGFEPLAGLFFGLGCFMVYRMFRQNNILSGVALQAVVTGVLMTYLALAVIPHIESMTQGPAIRFYKSLQGQDVYIGSYGHKSYAPYFYSAKPDHSDPRTRDHNWLLHGDIDKPVYLVSRSNNRELDTIPGFVFLRQEGGFRFYRRDPGMPSIW